MRAAVELQVDLSKDEALRIVVAPINNFLTLIYFQCEHQNLSVYVCPQKAQELYQRLGTYHEPWVKERLEAFAAFGG